MKMQLIYTRKSVAGYMASVHQDDKVSGTLSRLWDNPTSEHDCAMLVLPTMPDFTKDLVLDSVPVFGQHRAQPLRVDFDGAEGSCMWLHQEAGENENTVCVRDTNVAIDLAMHLLAWAYAEQQQPKTNQEES